MVDPVEVDEPVLTTPQVVHFARNNRVDDDG